MPHLAYILLGQWYDKKAKGLKELFSSSPEFPGRTFSLLLQCITACATPPRPGHFFFYADSLLTVVVKARAYRIELRGTKKTFCPAKIMIRPMLVRSAEKNEGHGLLSACRDQRPLKNLFLYSAAILPLAHAQFALMVRICCSIVAVFSNKLSFTSV